MVVYYQVDINCNRYDMTSKKKQTVPEGKRNVTIQMWEGDIEEWDHLCKVNRRSRHELVLIWKDRAIEALEKNPRARITP